MFSKKKLNDDGRDRIRIMEALTSFCWEIIDMYHHGIGPGALEPMTPALAKSMIADEINRQLGEPIVSGESRYARLRIAGNSHANVLMALGELAPGKVVTARWVGPRDDEDDLVLYATIRCESTEVLASILVKLEEKGMEVRDGTFGLFLR